MTCFRRGELELEAVRDEKVEFNPHRKASLRR